MPTVIVVGGPHGAGKTTLARELLLNRLPGEFVFLNADAIAEELSPFKADEVALQAGRELLRRFEEQVQSGRSFMVESTLGGATLQRRLSKAKALGYRVELLFLWLPNVESSLRRVAERVRRGGHHIAESAIRRRFARSYPNFHANYRHCADRWMLFDASPTPPEPVAKGGPNGFLEVLDPALYCAMRSDLPGFEKGVGESGIPYGGEERFYLDDLSEVLESVAKRLRDLEDTAADCLASVAEPSG